MFENKDDRVKNIKEVSPNDIARAIVILLIELDVKDKHSDTPLKNMDLFNANTGLGLIQTYWEYYNFKKSGFLYPCSSDFHLKKARKLLLDANFQYRAGIGIYSPTDLGIKTIEYLKNKYIKKVRGLTTVINVQEEIIQAFVKIACFFLNVDANGCLRNPFEETYKVYNFENNTWYPETIDLVLQEFSEYIDW